MTPEQAKQIITAWKETPALRAEFKNFDIFSSYIKNEIVRGKDAETVINETITTSRQKETSSQSPEVTSNKSEHIRKALNMARTLWPQCTLLHNEFTSLDSYLAYISGKATGKIKERIEANDPLFRFIDIGHLSRSHDEMCDSSYSAYKGSLSSCEENNKNYAPPKTKRGNFRKVIDGRKKQQLSPENGGTTDT